MKVSKMKSEPSRSRSRDREPQKKGKKKIKMGKSSSSNPTTNKFREAAKRPSSTSMFTSKIPSSEISSNGSKQANLTGNSLTLEALEKHNEALGGLVADMEDDTKSAGATTFNTWATNMTGCTNVTFNKCHRYINSSNALQKEILAVLAAITEVIKEKGGQGSDVQYFAILVTSLQEAEKTETIAAMSHLLSIVVKKVPVAVLQKQYSQVSKTLVSIITQCASSKDTHAPLKSVMSCLASLLRVIDAHTWLEPSTEHVYKALLLYTAHPKPKLRKAAQLAVKVILRGSLMMQAEDESARPPYHPAAPVTAQWCIDTLKSAKGLANRVDVLHTLALLKDVLSVCPNKQVKATTEVMLKLMTLTDPVVRSSCLEVMYRMFAAKPSIKAIPALMNAQIITALYDHQPSEKDSQPIGAWLRVMEVAAVNLARNEPSLCMSHLPKLFSVGMTCLLTDQDRVATSAAGTMKSLLTDCMAPAGKDLSKAGNADLGHVQKVVTSLATGLSYQFHSVWAAVLDLWATVYQVIGKIAPDMLRKVLVSMGDLRDTPHFAYKAEMDLALGAAVKSLGPRRVLEAIPLGINGVNDNPEFPRGWLLPVIRDNVTHTEMTYFTQYFLPLAAVCKSKAEECSRQSRTVESNAYDVLSKQIWSMLKGFCDHPIDLKTSFQGIAKSLGTALTDREDLRMDVMAALRSLINCSLDNDEDKTEVSRFAKNFLPILFNLFTAEGSLNINEGTRLAVLETIKIYFSVSDSKLISTFLDKCLDKMNEESIGSFRNIALLDLCIAMVPFAGSKGLKKMFDLSLPRLQSEDRTVQKKAYRVLEELTKGGTDACHDLLTSNSDTLRTTLLASLAKSSPSAKAPRLRCLIHIYNNLNQENMAFLMATLPEAILCTKEIGVRARAAAFDLIIVMSEAYCRWHQDKPEADALAEFTTKLLAGLVGSPHMISATLLALTRVVYHYKARMNGSILDYMTDQVCLLLGSKTREIVKTALGFIKVLLSAFENTVLASHLQDLLNGLHDIAVKGNMRRLTKIIYVKLIKKFGYELVLSMTKDAVHKLLKNIHKSEERSKRKNVNGEKENDDGEEDDEESEEESRVKGQSESIEDILADTDSEPDSEDEGRDRRRKGKGAKKGAWLMEGGDDKIMDFMDPSANKNVVTTNPKSSEKSEGKKDRDRDRGFKMAGDGRLIITQEEDEENAPKKGKRKGKGAAADSDDDDLEDLFAALGAKKSKSRKRTALADGDSDDDVDEAMPPAAKYKAGGSGIHRPVAKAKRGRDARPGQEYTSKKAAGDMKKKDKPDPYAYVPLNIANLNKRKMKKNQGTFSNLVKGAKKGAAKGAKSKGKADRGGKH